MSITTSTVTLDDIRAGLKRMGVAYEGDNGHVDTLCPQCQGQITGIASVAGVTLTCSGCELDRLADLWAFKDPLIATPQAQPDHGAIADELTKMLGLDAVGLGITRARIVGRGGAASADIYLTDNTQVTFERLRDFANPTKLAVEMAACTGAQPRLKAPMAVKALTLLRKIAAQQEAITADDVAFEWGSTFLQAASTAPVDMADQGSRWAAFTQLERDGLLVAEAASGYSVAQACTVLLDKTGTRYVRAGWFREHVKREDGTVSPQEIANRMERVGWARRGGSGRIKATRPGNEGTLGWNFYAVPVGWEESR